MLVCQITQALSYEGFSEGQYPYQSQYYDSLGCLLPAPGMPLAVLALAWLLVVHT